MDSSKLNENRDARPTVTIVGSGICGMFTGLALDRRGFDVTIIERDTPPPDCSANEAFFFLAKKGSGAVSSPSRLSGINVQRSRGKLS